MKNWLFLTIVTIIICQDCNFKISPKLNILLNFIKYNNPRITMSGKRKRSPLIAESDAGPVVAGKRRKIVRTRPLDKTRGIAVPGKRSPLSAGPGAGPVPGPVVAGKRRKIVRTYPTEKTRSFRGPRGEPEMLLTALKRSQRRRDGLERGIYRLARLIQIHGHRQMRRTIWAFVSKMCLRRRNYVLKCLTQAAKDNDTELKDEEGYFFTEEGIDWGDPWFFPGSIGADGIQFDSNGPPAPVPEPPSPPPSPPPPPLEPERRSNQIFIFLFLLFLLFYYFIIK